MNKHIVKYLLALATIAFVGGGCNVDDYNEEYLAVSYTHLTLPTN